MQTHDTQIIIEAGRRRCAIKRALGGRGATDENSPSDEWVAPIKIALSSCVRRRTLLVSNILYISHTYTAASDPVGRDFCHYVTLSGDRADMSDGLVCIISLSRQHAMVQRDASRGEKRALFSSAGNTCNTWVAKNKAEAFRERSFKL